MLVLALLGGSGRASCTNNRCPSCNTLQTHPYHLRSKSEEQHSSFSLRSVAARVYSSPREREQSLPEDVRSFKTHRLAQCIADTPIQPFLQGSDDVDHLAASCWEICVARKRIESPSHSESASQQAAGEGGESAVFAQLEQAVAALLRLMTFCGLPSPWEAVNMLKMYPELVGLQDNMLVIRMVQLRALLPDADLPTLVRRKPGYLLDQGVDDSIEHALGILKELMPHVNVQRQMSEEQQIWLTFASLVEGNRSGQKAP